MTRPIAVAARYEARVCGRLMGCGFEYHRGHGCLSLVSIVCCQVEVSVTSWPLIQRSPTECGVSECDREASTMRRPWPTRGCCVMKKKYKPVLMPNYKLTLLINSMEQSPF
jgi:hypothetical protein